MPYVPVQAITKYAENNKITSKDLEGIKNFVGEPASERTARRWLRYIKDGVADPSSTEAGIEQEVTDEEIIRVRELLIKNNKGLTAVEIAEAIDRSPSTAYHIVEKMKSEGYNISDESRKIALVKDISTLSTYDLSAVIADSMEVSIAVLSDLHCGSKCEQITHRKAFMQYARERGFRKFFVPGDLSTGIGVYKGHRIDTYAQTSEEQEWLITEAIRPEEGEDWYILGGNHDFSWAKNCEVDVIWRVCQKDERLHFLGYDSATIKLTDKHAIRLWHPSGGIPYAASYRLQKGIEQVMAENSFILSDLIQSSEDSLVKTILVGHLHRDASIHEGGVYALLASCFEGQTNYLARKPLYPRVAGNLLTFYLNDSGNVARMVSEHVPFIEIKDDYKNYPLESYLRATDEVEVVFRLDSQGD